MTAVFIGILFFFVAAPVLDAAGFEGPAMFAAIIGVVLMGSGFTDYFSPSGYPL